MVLVRWFVGVLVVAQLAVAAPQRIPVRIVISDAERAKMTSDQLALVDLLEAQVAQNVFIWGNFHIELPTLLVPPGTQTVELKPFPTFNVNQDITNSAFEDEARTKRKKLTAEQIDQLQAESLLYIESPAHPGQYFVYEVTYKWLHSGDPEIKVILDEHLAASLRHITIGIPASLLNDNPISFRSSLRNMGYGLRNSLSLLIGLVEEKPKYAAHEVDAIVAGERAHYATTGVVREPDVKDDLAEAGIHGLLPKKLTKEATAILLEIDERAGELWTGKAMDVQIALEAQLRASGKDPAEHGLLIDTVLKRKQMELLMDLVESDPRLEAIQPGLGKELRDASRAITIVRLGEHNFEQEMRKAAQDAEADYIAHHRFRGRERDLVAAAGEAGARRYYLQHRQAAYLAIEDELNRRGLHEAAVQVHRAYQFMEKQAPRLEAEFKAEVEAARVFDRQKARIWRASNWIPVPHKDKDNPGDVFYTAEVYESLPEVRTNYWFWRLQNLGQRTKVIWKGGLYAIAQNWMNSPFWSAKSVFYPKPFIAAYMMDSKTKEILPDTHSETQTLVSNVANLWDNVSRSRTEFWASPDVGVLPKRGVKNWTNWVWNYVFKGTLLPLGFLCGQGGGFLLNTTGTAIAGMSAWAWSPIASLLISARNAATEDEETTWDSSRPNSPFPRVPLIAEFVGRFGLMGVGQFALSVLRTVVWHPGWAALHLGASTTAWLIRKGRDKLFRQVIRWSGGRVPAAAKTMAFNLRSGPGYGGGFYYQISREGALLEMLRVLDNIIVNHYKRETESQIAEPRAAANQYVNGVQGAVQAVVGSVGKNGSLFEPISQMETDLTTQLQTLIAARNKIWKDLKIDQHRGKLRMTVVDLNAFMLEATAIVRRACETKLFPFMGQAAQDSFWTQAGALRGDWTGATRWVLSQALGEPFLVPIEETDKTMRVHVNPPGFADLLDQILTGAQLKLDHEVVVEEKREPKPQKLGGDYALERKTAAEICAGYIGLLSRDMDRLPHLATYARQKPQETLSLEEMERLALSL